LYDKNKRGETCSNQEFYVSLESFHNIDIENELAFFILNCKLQIMAKKKLEIKLAIWLLHPKNLINKN